MQSTGGRRVGADEWPLLILQSVIMVLLIVSAVFVAAKRSALRRRSLVRRSAATAVARDLIPSSRLLYVVTGTPPSYYRTPAGDRAGGRAGVRAGELARGQAR